MPSCNWNSTSKVMPLPDNIQVRLRRLLTAVLVAGSVAAMAEPTPEAKPESTDAAARRRIVNRVEDVLTRLEQAAPGLLGSRSQADTERMVGGLLRGAGCGVDWQAGPENVNPATAAAIKTFEPLLLNGGRLLYLRLDRPLPPDAAQIAELRRLLDKNSTPPTGIILDLRNCRGHGASDAETGWMQLLTPGSGGESWRHALGAPLLLLTGSGTGGSAERLTATVVKAKRGLSLGEATAGTPYELKKLPLTTGGVLLTPAFPSGTVDFRTCPQQPVIVFKATPQSDFDALRREHQIPAEDQCLSRAADFLITLQALHRKMTFPAPKK